MRYRRRGRPGRRRSYSKRRRSSRRVRAQRIGYRM